MGSRSKFNRALLDRNCTRLAENIPLTQICRYEGNLSPRAVRYWESKQPDVAAAIVGARADGESALAESCLEIADTPQVGNEVVVARMTTLSRLKRGDMLGHRTLQIAARLKLLATYTSAQF